MAEKLWILGAGQYGQVAKEIAEAMGYFAQIAFLDDQNPAAAGKLTEIEQHPQDAAFVAMGNPTLRKQWYARISNPATLIHPTAQVSSSATIGEGAILEAGAVVCSHAHVGKGCIIMSHAVVGHDAVVKDFCQLKYGCVIPERSCVPEGSKIDCNIVFTETK